MLTEVPTIWKKRLNAFTSTVDKYLDWLNRNTPPRYRTAEVLLGNLKKFSDRQFERFNNFQGYLHKSPRPIIPFPMPDTALCLILDQAFTDLSVVQRAIGQRMVDHTREILDIADQLAWLALADPVRPYLDSPSTTVLTYLHKSTNVRLIPYAPIAVVGIPYTGILKVINDQIDIDTAVPQDYLAIPHEIGHHVFWHCKISSAETEEPIKLFDYLIEALKEDDAFVARWAEEIFADMYGLAIGGPLIAKAGQTVQQVVAADKFFSDDGEHPTSALRPRIAAKILNYLKYETHSETLLQDWLAVCETRKTCLWANEKNALNDWFKVYEDAQWVPIDWIMGATTALNNQKAVDRMVLKLLGLNVIAALKDTQSWWNGYLNISGKSNLDDMFDAHLRQTLAGRLTTELDTINDSNWSKDMSLLFPEIEQKPNYGYTEPVLRFILKINGWATKGADRDPIPNFR